MYEKWSACSAIESMMTWTTMHHDGYKPGLKIAQLR
jgi:hypothetical protein